MAGGGGSSRWSLPFAVQQINGSLPLICTLCPYRKLPPRARYLAGVLDAGVSLSEAGRILNLSKTQLRNRWIAIQEGVKHYRPPFGVYLSDDERPMLIRYFPHDPGGPTVYGITE